MSAQSASTKPPRFSACGDPALEARVLRDLSECVERLLAGLPRDAAAGIVLSGAYGLGEGSAWLRKGELVPFDDYEVYVVAATLPRATVERLSLDIRTVGVELSGRVGVRVMVHVLDRGALHRPAATRAMADLHAGHRVLVGPAGLLQAMRGPAPEALPAIEGTRLVLAGVSRLTRARASLERLAESSVSARIARDLYNAWRMAGEGWLIGNGLYDPSVFQRLTRVWREAPIAELREGYVRAVRALLEGTLSPDPTSLADEIEAASDALRRTLAEVERVRVAAPSLEAEATFRS